MSCERGAITGPRLVLVFAALTIVLASAAPAAAEDDPGPDAAASALFHAGRDLIKKGQWKEGCHKLAASMKRFPAPSTLLNLALCREHEGRVATAWAMAQRARVLNRDTVGNDSMPLARSSSVGSSRVSPSCGCASTPRSTGHR